MNRVIKFRGKRIDNGEWAYGHYIPNAICHRIVTDFAVVKADKYTDDGLSHCSGEFHIVNSLSVGQFTGLTDKNGTGIYEGDIIKDLLTTATMKVVFGHNKNNAYNGWYCEYINVSVRDVSINGDNDTNQNYNIEIIGNITDNPELIK